MWKLVLKLLGSRGGPGNRRARRPPRASKLGRAPICIMTKLTGFMLLTKKTSC